MAVCDVAPPPVVQIPRTFDRSSAPTSDGDSSSAIRIDRSGASFRRVVTPGEQAQHTASRVAQVVGTRREERVRQPGQSARGVIDGVVPRATGALAVSDGHQRPLQQAGVGQERLLGIEDVGTLAIRLTQHAGAEALELEARA